MEKVTKEKFMGEVWERYNATKDIEFLANVRRGTFFWAERNGI